MIRLTPLVAKSTQVPQTVISNPANNDEERDAVGLPFSTSLLPIQVTVVSLSEIDARNTTQGEQTELKKERG